MYMYYASYKSYLHIFLFKLSEGREFNWFALSYSYTGGYLLFYIIQTLYKSLIHVQIFPSVSIRNDNQIQSPNNASTHRSYFFTYQYTRTLTKSRLTFAYNSKQHVCQTTLFDCINFVFQNINHINFKKQRIDDV